MKKIKVFIILPLLVALVVGALFVYKTLTEDYHAEQIAREEQSFAIGKGGKKDTSPEGGDAPEEGEGADSEAVLAPDFTVLDADGKEVRLSDKTGTPVIVNFWASWCGPCRSEMPEFDAAWKEYKDSIDFMMINLTYGSETKESADAFIKESGFSFPVLYDTKGDASGTYSVSAIPTTYFVNSNGELVARAVGAIDGDTLKQGIDMVLSGE